MPVEYSLVESTTGKGIVNCALCNSIISDIFLGFQNGQTDEEISTGIGQRCETLNLYNFKVCYGTAAIAMVKIFRDIFHDPRIIIFVSFHVQPTIRYIYGLEVVEGNICGMLLQTENCGFSDPGLLEWSVAPSSVPKPPVTEPVLPPVYITYPPVSKDPIK